jgi:hypothetical protein
MHRRSARGKKFGEASKEPVDRPSRSARIGHSFDTESQLHQGFGDSFFPQEPEFNIGEVPCHCDRLGKVSRWSNCSS